VGAHRFIFMGAIITLDYSPRVPDNDGSE
jgi:hypothetical protein